MKENSNPRDRLSLSEAVRGAQLASADRNDVLTDTKEADLARIEVLAQDLQEVFDEVPVDDPQWQFAVSKGQQPRLWIDVTSHVTMARDRRTYRFVRDTRNGRILVAESTEVRPVADAVTRYIAERIVERRQMMEGSRVGLIEPKPVKETRQIEQSMQPAVTIPAIKQPSRLSSFITAAYWFLIGAAIGSGAFVMFFWDRVSNYF
ncbi:hypothetical protein QFZ34_001801 [Phyllobacterium ifriqiyense]|uniref:Uncharacterized protein n=1 Tax=Phyllobacterium ifriqiyense TaxID=314238 RepID=A0ABU0S783_9HYPH|nr:hypothetical protein [Phyllobacterium ifriqiyense]MDQ0996619.1 hypothetical protein [Phyllobacterium ifriqiyense]